MLRFVIMPILLAFFVIITACGDLGAKKGDMGSPVQLTTSINAPTTSFPYDSWSVTYIHAGIGDQTFTAPKGQNVSGKVDQGHYQIRIDLLNAGVVVASNAFPPCTLTEADIGSPFQFSLCRAP